MQNCKNNGGGNKQWELPSWIERTTHNSARLMGHQNNLYQNEIAGRLIHQWIFFLVQSTHLGKICWSKKITPFSTNPQRFSLHKKNSQTAYTQEFLTTRPDGGYTVKHCYQKAKKQKHYNCIMDGTMDQGTDQRTH